MSGLSDGGTGTNRFNPYLKALKEAGADCDIFKGMILVGYKGTNTLISFDGVHREWFGTITEVKSAEEAVKIVTG